ncbi:hypothetical protein DU19_0305 [Chlamydia muridarum]|nr:hypothetical protein DU17_0306 [Chlamydia muridarum]KDU81273.1 hypothetical protein DU18_0307 [Chlamydia muridarum]KDU82025.1 hypothetical protein DU19_0305 [Chlamydia muridarum]KDU83224.1 hypothetical protein DU20_0304 [Chlamydia muridarum]KDU84078.1 hypothetical protein DU21_0306 [Chlamydia muridarum]
MKKTKPPREFLWRALFYKKLVLQITRKNQSVILKKEVYSLSV